MIHNKFEKFSSIDKVKSYNIFQAFAAFVAMRQHFFVLYECICHDLLYHYTFIYFLVGWFLGLPWSGYLFRWLSFVLLQILGMKMIISPTALLGFYR